MMYLSDLGVSQWFRRVKAGLWPLSLFVSWDVCLLDYFRRSTIRSCSKDVGKPLYYHTRLVGKGKEIWPGILLVTGGLRELLNLGSA